MKQNLFVRAVGGVGTVAALLVLPAACGNDRQADPLGMPELSEAAGASLLACPTGESHAASARVAPSGGNVGLGRHRMTIPAGAVADTVLITMVAPASDYLLVEMRANAQEHYQFLAPLTVTIDYSHCRMDRIAAGPLSVWLVDPSSGALLQNMGGTDDRGARTVTFTTDHFSGYAIAN